MTFKIEINGNLDSDMAKKVASRLYSNRDSENISLFFNQISFTYPFSSLFLLSTIWTVINYRKEQSLSPIKFEYCESNSACTYLGYFGFFRSIGVDFGDENSGMRNTYIPITQIKSKVLMLEAKNRQKPFQEIIQEKSEQIVKILLPNDSYENEEDQLLSYSLREIIRNSFEHGMARSCYVMGQRWKNGYAELAILDRGIGIK